MRDSRLAPIDRQLAVQEVFAPIRDDLSTVQKVFDRELAGDLPFLNRLCDQIRSHRGKMLRPALLLLSAEATGGITHEHHILAAVVEMVHMATLVHDDVLDEADERRREPTIRATDGNVSAVLLGDYLISHAYHLCSAIRDTHAARRIAATTNTVCEGELMQNHHRSDVRLTESAYLDIAQRKTGALTAVACELGAQYAGADRDAVEALRGYGHATGTAFQIIDDVLDVTGDPERVGKTLGLDLALGKLTLPTIHCLANAPPHLAEALRAAVSGVDPIEPARLRSWLEESGSLEHASACAAAHVAEALKCLETVPLSEARSALAAMAEFIVDREF